MSFPPNNPDEMTGILRTLDNMDIRDHDDKCPICRDYFYMKTILPCNHASIIIVLSILFLITFVLDFLFSLCKGRNFLQ